MPKLFLLDVKQGNSSVLVDSEGVTIFDSGPGSALLDFITSNGLTEIATVILTHADVDHIGGMMGLLSSSMIKIGNVYVNTDSLKASAIWEDLLYTLYDQDKRHKLNFKVGVTPQLNGTLNHGEVVVEVLAPNQYLASRGPGNTDHIGRSLTTNSLSAVIRLLHQERPVALILGDIDRVALDNILEDHVDMNAWLIVFPHHGGNPGGANVANFTGDLCNSIKPAVVVFSVGSNPLQFPNLAVVSTIQKSLPHVTMLSTGASGVLEAFIHSNPECKHRNKVGTVRIEFSSDPPGVCFESL